MEFSARKAFRADADDYRVSLMSTTDIHEEAAPQPGARPPSPLPVTTLGAPGKHGRLGEGAPEAYADFTKHEKEDAISVISFAARKAFRRAAPTDRQHCRTPPP